jgi:hypothetical protein
VSASQVIPVHSYLPKHEPSAPELQIVFVWPDDEVEYLNSLMEGLRTSQGPVFGITGDLSPGDPNFHIYRVLLEQFLPWLCRK